MNFPLIMLVLLIITGGIVLLDRYVLQRRRGPDGLVPWWVEYPKSFFPVILVVFFLRSFLVEPFKIPSGSMIPTLLVGDFILVNKYAYGIRLPVANVKIIDNKDPRRGDVMVFRYPVNPSMDYIKRVVGIPGDTVTYQGKRLTVNDVPVKMEPAGEYTYVESGLNYIYSRRFKEKLGEHEYHVLINPGTDDIHLGGVHPFPYHENCSYNDRGFTCKVPPGHYFAMGDNRDSSADSRYWGFVPDRNIVGKAFMIWWNFSDLSRIGLSID